MKALDLRNRWTFSMIKIGGEMLCIRSDIALDKSLVSRLSRSRPANEKGWHGMLAVIRCAV